MKDIFKAVLVQIYIIISFLWVFALFALLVSPDLHLMPTDIVVFTAVLTALDMGINIPSRSIRKLLLYSVLISSLISDFAAIYWYSQNKVNGDYLTLSILILGILVAASFGQTALSQLRELGKSEPMVSKAFNGKAEKPVQLNNELLLTKTALVKKEKVQA